MSLERREQLVEDLINEQPRLQAFVRELPLDMIAGSWDLTSYSYQRGFEAMWDLAVKDSSGLLLHPLLLLWRQSVELSIKAAISEIAGTLDLKLGHDLDRLLDALLDARSELGHQDDDEHTASVREMIAVVQSFDPSADRFRYPANRNGKAFEGVTADLDELFQAHWIVTTWCEGAAIEAKESGNI